MSDEEKYIDFMVVPYALAQVLYALEQCGIKDYAITLEDNDLHIRIPVSHVQENVYPELKKDRIGLDKNTIRGYLCKNE